MTKAKDGDKVKVNYSGKFKEGTVFDSSEGSEPLEFQLGQGQLIPGFEKTVIGMAPGESRTVDIPSDQAYGPYREELTQQVPRKQLPEDMELQVGQRLQIGPDEGQPMVVEITAVSDTAVTLDGNHPLAGKDLVFDIELVEIM
ncbi:MAG: peptidylprolyl isomerase [bacterium]|nr:peptidylprolyl isomerase [bacterium]